MMNLSTSPRPWYRSARRPAMLAGGAALLLVVVFGALVQSGVLAPVFWRSGVSSGPLYSSESINNGSWRAWSVTASFASGGSEESLASLGTLRVNLFASGYLAVKDSKPMHQITVGAGGQFGIGINLERRSCYVESLPAGKVINEINAEIPVLLNVSTPLGTRTITETVPVECDNAEAGR
jgi:hypothetical protein